MKNVVRALIRRSWLLAVFLLVGLAAGTVLAAVVPPTYQATALVQLNAQSHSSLIIQPVAAYGALVTSDVVLDPVFQAHPDLDRGTFLAKDLTVTTDDPSQTITIAVISPKPKEAAAIANQLAGLLVAQQNVYIAQQYAKELDIVRARIADEQTSISKLYQQISQTPSTNTAAIQALQSQVTQLQNLQSNDISTEQQLVTEQGLYSEPLAIVQSATAPTRPSSLTGLIPVGPVVFLMCAIVGLVVIYSLERGAGRISDAYATQHETSLPVLGAIRWTRPDPSSRAPQALRDAKSRFAEDCRVMMADVLHNAEKAHARTIAVTGLRDGAGATTVAVALAVLLANTHRRVLLIDANLYHPALAARLRLVNEAGLARLLESARLEAMPATSVVQGSSAPVQVTSRLPVYRYIEASGIEGLNVIPAGSATVNPSALLSMPEMDQVLGTASEQADLVVIDCPALIHAEAHILGSLSDQTLVVVDATTDRIQRIMKTREEMANTGVNISGLIINKLGRWI